MNKVVWVAVAGVVLSALVLSADWPSSSGNAQRDGWLRNGEKLSRESAANGDIKLLYSFRADAKAQRFGTPVLLSNIIGWKGFKALMFLAGESDVYSIDYQLGRPYFRTHIEDRKDQTTALCPGGITASVVINGNSGQAARPAAAGAAGASGWRGPGANVFAVGSDGKLQTLRQQDGDNKATAPVPFVPVGSRVSDLNIAGPMIYAATQNGCGGNPNALYALDLSTTEKKVVSFATGGSGLAGSAGVAVALDSSTVYGLLPDANKVVALDAKSLTVKVSFTPAGSVATSKAGATPATFTWNGKDVVVDGGSDGRIYLLDAASLDAMAQSEVVGEISNAFATWEDPKDSNSRWIYSSVDGAVVAFKVVDNGGKPTLVAQWKSRALIAPAAPVVTNGLVFALSTGQGSTPKNAVLYALDSSTGKEIWSSGLTATSYATGGIAVNTSMVVFATHDSQVHAYGVPILF